jgi:hypothetical protein
VPGNVFKVVTVKVVTMVSHIETANKPKAAWQRARIRPLHHGMCEAAARCPGETLHLIKKKNI